VHLRRLAVKPAAPGGKDSSTCARGRNVKSHLGQLAEVIIDRETSTRWLSHLERGVSAPAQRRSVGDCACSLVFTTSNGVISSDVATALRRSISVCSKIGLEVCVAVVSLFRVTQCMLRAFVALP
jgi:hypothetical protein